MAMVGVVPPALVKPATESVLPLPVRVMPLAVFQSIAVPLTFAAAPAETVSVPFPPAAALVPPMKTSLALFQVVPLPVIVRLPVPPDCPARMAKLVCRVPPPENATFDCPWNSEMARRAW